jgi:peptide/nickel transport system substrate-binding protein
VAAKLDIRWQLLLAVICLGLVLSLLSFQVQSAGLCTTRVPAPGGDLMEGMVGAPQRLNPLLSDANPVDQALTNLIFDGLTRYDAQGRLTPALARAWAVSEDGRTIGFTLRDDVQWHDGEPVTAADVAFTYGLMQDENFPGLPGLTTLWRNVTITVASEVGITFTLPTAYGPFLDATTRGILPAHHLEGVTAATLADHPFNQAPIGTGPFLVVPGDNWQTTGQLRLAPNPVQWWQGTQLGTLVFRFYPDDEALLQAFDAGEIQAMSYVSDELLPQAAERPGMRLFTAPDERYSQLLFNQMADSAPALRSAEIRKALAYSLEREALIDTALNGQGLPLEGPYLPTSWAYNPGLLTHYTYQPGTADTLFAEGGWTFAGEGGLRQREGITLTLRLLVPDAPLRVRLAETIVEQWQAAGVEGRVEAVPAAELLDRLAQRQFEVALVEVEPLGDPDLYDFWSQEAIIRGQNYAGWNSQRPSEALEAARQLWNVDERRPYYDAFLRFFEADLPALTLYQHIYTYALSDSVKSEQSAHGLAEVGRIDEPRERYATLGEWFLLYRDVFVSCPAEA